MNPLLRVALLAVALSCALVKADSENIDNRGKREETVKTVKTDLALTNTPLKQGINETLAAEPGAGQKLFERNCAHCHGEDARGDEGPSLHNLKLSDARIANRIKDGVKGEMPRFGSKLSDEEITALTAYLRSLKN
jgi:mono/diheme cytochrome c family protein